MKDKNTFVSNPKPVRVLILDNHTLVRHGLRLLIESLPENKVVGETGSRPQAVSMVEQLQPDIILLELNLDGNLSLEIIPELVKAANRARIILVTGINDTYIHNQAIQLGVLGVIRKEESGEVLLKAIQKVYLGEVWIDRVMMANVLLSKMRSHEAETENPEAAKIASLSEREREVIRLVGQGLKNKQIAEQLSISEVTVRHHLTAIFRKLDISDRLELTIYAYRNGLAELPL